MYAEVGTVVEGTVTGIMPFGAFIHLSDGRTGLVHISEVSNEYVKDLAEYLHEGQIVKVQILSIDQNGKIKLSMKRAAGNGEEKEKVKVNTKREPNSKPNKFEDILAKFLKDSDEKLHDIKKNSDSKRGGSGRKSAYF